MNQEKIKHIANKQHFEMLFRSHYRSLCAYALVMLHDAEEAEELVQTFFCDLWEKRESVQVSGEWKPYLLKAIKNRCLNLLRKQQTRARVHDEIQLYSPELLEADQSFELRSKVDEAYAALPEQCGLVFRKSREEGLKYKEIADKMGISIKTVENQMGKALKIFREHLKDYLPLVVLAVQFVLNYGEH